MIDPWLGSSPRAIVAVLITILAMYVTVLAFTRLVGLRSLSKMDPIDLTITVAVGGVIAIAIMAPREPIVEGVIALVGLYTLQGAVARARRKWAWFRRWVENDPVLLVYEGEIIEDHMEQTDMTRMDLMEALREHDVASLEGAEAVVLERTGEFSVVKAPEETRHLDESVFDVVRLGDQEEKIWEEGKDPEEGEVEEVAEEDDEDPER